MIEKMLLTHILLMMEAENQIALERDEGLMREEVESKKKEWKPHAPQCDIIASLQILF